jgi:hypothetical protein
MDLTTIANVKSLLSIAATDNDEIILAIVKGVSSEIENFIDRQLETKERTEYFDVRKDQTIFPLKAYPVSALKAYSDSYRLFGTEIDSTNMTFLGDDGNLIIDQQIPDEGAKALKVVYTGGLAANQGALQVSYPDIEMAARLQSAFVFEKRQKLNVGSESVSGSSVSVSQELKFLPEVESIITRYRRQSYV